jgi:hypothetical protein
MDSHVAGDKLTLATSANALTQAGAVSGMALDIPMDCMTLASGLVT